MIDEAKQYVEVLRRLKEEVFKPGTDYGEVGGVSKPTLLKPGAEKAAKFFNLSAKFDHLENRIDPEVGYVSFGYRCTLIDADGREVMQGEGYANSSEDKYLYRWEVRPAPDDRTMAEMKAARTGRFRKEGDKWIWMEKVQAPASSAVGAANTLSKMAQKRAFVAAVLFATGLSEFFTQDVEDMHHDAPAKPAPRKAAPPPKPAPASTTPPPAPRPEKPTLGGDTAIIGKYEDLIRPMSTDELHSKAVSLVEQAKADGLSAKGVGDLQVIMRNVYRMKKAAAERGE